MKLSKTIVGAVLAGILYGFGVGTVVAVAMPYLECTVAFSAAKLSSLVAAALFGSVVVTPLTGPFVEWIGRKRAVLAAAALFAMAAPLVCFSGGTYALLLVGLLVQGVSMGVMGVAVPLYLTETLSDDMRGRGSTLFQLSIIGGILLSGLLGLMTVGLFGPADSASVSVACKMSAWRFLFGVEALPAVFLLGLSFFLDESPYWRKERLGHKGMAAVTEDRKDSLWQRKYVLPFILVVIILACTQGVGINSVLGYSVKMFQRAGLSGSFANWADFSFKAVMFVMTAVACSVVDTKGRKFLMQIGTTGVFVGLVVAGLAFLGLDYGLLKASLASGLVVATGVMVFVAAFAIGPGACTWILPAELLPGRIRATGMGVALLFDYLISTGFQAALLPVVERVGYGVLFCIFALFGVFYCITVWVFLPETKGRTLEDIEQSWTKAK